MAKHKQKRGDIIWEYQWAYIKWNYYARLRPALRRYKNQITNKTK